MKGLVVSAKLQNTATVLVTRSAKHPLYKKTFIRSKKYLVWDTVGVKEGDIVEIINCKPLSKRKSWKVVQVVGKNLAEIAEAQLKKAAAEVIAEVMPEEKEGDRVQGIGSSETEENKEVEKKMQKKRKDKIAPKP